MKGDTNRKGFASIDPERQREIASMGGKAAHAKGMAHRFTSEEAKIAGKKGGQTVSQNREHMAEIGRKGGQKSRRKKDGRVDATNGEAVRAAQDSDALSTAVGTVAVRDSQGASVGSGAN